MSWIKLGDIHFDSDNIVAVRPSGLLDATTVVYTRGQSAVDGGFTVNEPIDAVLERLAEARLQEALQFVDAAIDGTVPEPVIQPEPDPDPDQGDLPGLPLDDTGSSERS